jgi:hypothetical protein
MRVPADVYHPSAKRLDERIKPHLYDLGTETKSVSAAGFVALNGRNCYVGESFAGVDVAVERDEKSGLLHVRYANVKLGSLDDSPNARLRPTPSVGRVNLALPTEAKYQYESVTDVLGLSVTDVPVHTKLSLS